MLLNMQSAPLSSPRPQISTIPKPPPTRRMSRDLHIDPMFAQSWLVMRPLCLGP